MNFKKLYGSFFKYLIFNKQKRFQGISILTISILGAILAYPEGLLLTIPFIVFLIGSYFNYLK